MLQIKVLQRRTCVSLLSSRQIEGGEAENKLSAIIIFERIVFIIYRVVHVNGPKLNWVCARRADKLILMFARKSGAGGRGRGGVGTHSAQKTGLIAI